MSRHSIQEGDVLDHLPSIGFAERLAEKRREMCDSAKGNWVVLRRPFKGTSTQSYKALNRGFREPIYETAIRTLQGERTLLGRRVPDSI